MVEFLSEFVVHCISKDLNSCVYQNEKTTSQQRNIENTSAEAASTADALNDNKIFELPLSDNGKSSAGPDIGFTKIFKYLSGDQVSRFIKKTLKIYKALRVLERNKAPETPYFSKSLEKLIRYFSKKFPDNCGPRNSINNRSISP